MVGAEGALGKLRCADHNRPGCKQSLHHCGRFIRHEISHDFRAASGGNTRREEQILDRHRHAMQRTHWFATRSSLVTLLRLDQRLVRQHQGAGF